MSRASRRLRKINNKMEYRIDPVDFDTMTDIECYLESTSLTDMQRQEVRRDIIDMLIDGRRRGGGLRRISSAATTARSATTSCRPSRQRPSGCGRWVG